VIKENKFSLCFAKNGGYFFIGSVNNTFHKEEINYISYENSRNLYSVKLNDIQVNNLNLEISNEYFSIIDSGTTVSYFPVNIFNKIKQYIYNYCSQVNKCLGDYFESDLGICFKLKININYIQFMESMPKLNFIFENKINYYWNADSYLFNDTDEREKRKVYCMGFVSWE
jgi:hypothetical protein